MSALLATAMNDDRVLDLAAGLCILVAAMEAMTAIAFWLLLPDDWAHAIGVLLQIAILLSLALIIGGAMTLDAVGHSMGFVHGG